MKVIKKIKDIDSDKGTIKMPNGATILSHPSGRQV
jgi:hypothetical protein